MTAIELRFVTGKWHATPWGRQVNEGAVEWPPAPWRLLRALLAVWHYKFPDVSESEVRALVTSLSAPPSYCLPQVSQGHTRHFMPATNDVRTKIFDTFIAVSPLQPVTVVWPGVKLDQNQRNLLNRLLEAMSYLGRAESWVDARLGEHFSESPNAIPLNESGVNEGQELVRLLAPIPDAEYSQWREATVTRTIEGRLTEKRLKAVQKGKDPQAEKLSKKELDGVRASLPSDAFEALHVETDSMREAGWTRPPGSQWLDYVRPKEGFSLPVTRRTWRRKKPPTVARLAITGTVLPRLTEAVWIGERIRTALMSISGASAVFAGKSEDGKQSRRSHTHAHFLTESAAKARSISHVTLFAHEGFDSKSLQAISRLRSVWGRDGFNLQIVCLGNGEPCDFGGFNEAAGQTPILAKAKVWESRTPFVPTDHLHVRGAARHDPKTRTDLETKELERIVRKELSRRDWLSAHADSVRIEHIEETSLGGKKTRWLEFRRERNRGGGKKSNSTGYGFRLTFPTAVEGPIVLGYGCHFGLGLFTAIQE